MKLKVLKVKKETPTISTVQFEKSKDFTYTAGQYLIYKLNVDDPKGNTRPFSIAASPDDKTIDLSFRISDSPFKQALLKLKKGDEVEYKGPFGVFKLDESKPAIMLSGGIGITPLRSMIRNATAKKSPTKITMFYSNRNPEEIAYKKEFDSLVKKNKNLKMVYSVDSPTPSKEQWTGNVGYINDKIVNEQSQDMKNALFYICGPPGMVNAMLNLLKSMNIEESRLRIEHFEGY